MAKLYRGNHSLRAQALKYWLWGTACFLLTALFALWCLVDWLGIGLPIFAGDGDLQTGGYTAFLSSFPLVSFFNLPENWSMGGRILFEFLILAVLFFSGHTFFRRYQTFRAGADGERRVLEGLKGLNDSYSIFTNYCIARGRGRDEVDALVVGENGIFIVEAKNHSGTISGGFKDREWEQAVMRGGKKIKRKKMKNPAKQTMRHVVNIARFLKSGGFKDWVEGILVFSNPAAALSISTGELPVFRTGAAAARFITEYEPRQYLSQDEVRSIIGYLKKNGI